MLVESLQEEARKDPDLVLVSLEGDIVPTHRSVKVYYLFLFFISFGKRMVLYCVYTSA